MHASRRLSILLPRPKNLSPQTSRPQWQPSDRHPPRTTRRHASTNAASKPSTKLRNALYGTALLAFTSLGYLYLTDTRAGVHQYLAVPLLRLLHADAEDAHHAGIRYLRRLHDVNLHPRERGSGAASDAALADLAVEVFGETLRNPVGTSAGIDKDAQIPAALFALGPAVVEVGGVTPLPQPGNPRPRVFRVPSQQALINRYGLNSEGAEHVAMRLRERVRHFAYARGLGTDVAAEQHVLDGDAGVPPGSLASGRLLAVQIAKNKATPDADIAAVTRDYVDGVRHLAPYADILVVNVSSPNTPGLRGLQAVAPLTAILSGVVAETRRCPRRRRPPRVMVKVSPDEDADAQIHGICAAVCAAGVDGVIVANTTTRRPPPSTPRLPARDADTLREPGGYSGPLTFPRTLDLVRRYRARLAAAAMESPSDAVAAAAPKVIFASGGISTGAQCLQVLDAGASVCQLYTAMMYGGVGTVTRIKREMREAMRAGRRPAT